MLKSALATFIALILIFVLKVFLRLMVVFVGQEHREKYIENVNALGKSSEIHVGALVVVMAAMAVFLGVGLLLNETYEVFFSFATSAVISMAVIYLFLFLVIYVRSARQAA